MKLYIIILFIINIYYYAKWYITYIVKEIFNINNKTFQISKTIIIFNILVIKIIIYC